jgi:hypothetical protein
MARHGAAGGTPGSGAPAPGRRPVGRSLVLRAPTPAELAGRRPLVLTPRDRDVLGAVHAHGVLTAAQIEVAFYSGGAGGRARPGTPSANCYVRLRRLWLWGYLARLEQAMPRGLGGSRPALYALGPRGAVYAGDCDDPGVPPVGRLRPDRLAGRALEHDLTAATFWARLCALLRAAPVPVAGWRWVAERRLRALRLTARDPRTGRRLPFLPDGYLEVEYAHDEAPAGGAGGDPVVQCAVLEVDLGTLPLPRFRRKARAFELALSGGLFARRFGRPEFEVLVVASDRGRLARLWAAARREVPEGRWAWWSFAPLEALTRERFGGCEWLTLEGRHTPLLYDRVGGS